MSTVFRTNQDELKLFNSTMIRTYRDCHARHRRYQVMASSIHKPQAQIWTWLSRRCSRLTSHSVHSVCRGPSIQVQTSSKHTGQALVALRNMTGWQGRKFQASSFTTHLSGPVRMVSEAYSQGEASKAFETQLLKWLPKSQRAVALKKNNRL